MRRHSRLVLVAAVLVLSATAAAVLASSSGPSSTRALASHQLAAPGGAAASFNTVRATAHKLGRRVIVGHSLKNDTSRPLRDIRPVRARHAEVEPASRNPLAPDRKPSRSTPTGGVVQRTNAAKVPSPSQTFEGIDYPGVSCNCLPPDTDGEIGQTQYVQIVNDGFQVFSKSGTSLYGPVDIATIWSGFGGVCETDGGGDPIVLYDQLANRWLISQFAGVNLHAGTGIPTDECIAISATNSATGAWHRYDFNLGTNFFDYPHIGVWPDAYYMSDNVFNSAGTAYLGPQPFAFNRAAMLAGSPATFITTGVTVGSTEDPYLPADLDGSMPPPSGAPDPFVEWPGNGTYKVYRFHVNWASPGSSTFTLAGAPAASAFSMVPCGGTFGHSCIPQPGTTQGLDSLGDRLMFRAAYRNFGDHESLVSNYTVFSGGVAAPRWFELHGLTSGTPALAQESTYQPDTTWRWMASAAQDQAGDMALGFSASSAVTFPAIRYAGRLAADPANQLGQGETTMFAGSGSQTHQRARWGDYSAMSIDPTDDCTLWYTNEYSAPTSGTSGVNWKTRIGTFKFPQCPPRTLTVSLSGTGSGTVTSNPAGISCGATCTFKFGNGTSVSLAPVAASGSVFSGFSGDCSGASCSIAMSANHAVTATFTKKAPVKCVVPKVVGLKLSKAKSKIKKAHCRVGKVTKKHASKRKKGKVIKQSPKAHKKLKAGSKVNLTVGK